MPPKTKSAAKQIFESQRSGKLMPVVKEREKAKQNWQRLGFVMNSARQTLDVSRQAHADASLDAMMNESPALEEYYDEQVNRTRAKYETDKNKYDYYKTQREYSKRTFNNPVKYPWREKEQTMTFEQSFEI